MQGANFLSARYDGAGSSRGALASQLTEDSPRRFVRPDETTRRRAASRRRRCASAVSRVREPDKRLAAPLELAVPITVNSPSGVRRTMHAVRGDLRAASLEQGMVLHNRNQALSEQTQSTHAALTSLLVRRNPAFTGRH